MNKSQGDHWEHSLLKYLMTPIRLQDDDRSPLKLMQCYTICGILPVRKEESHPQDLQNLEDRRQEQKHYYNESSWDLNILKEGQNVFYYDLKKGNWLPGIIMKKLHKRSYHIVTKWGRPITRNWVDLKPHLGNVEIKFKSDPPCTPLVSSSPFVRNVQKPISNKVPDSNTTSTEKPVSISINNKSPEVQGNNHLPPTTYVTKLGRAVKKPSHFLDK